MSQQNSSTPSFIRLVLTEDQRAQVRASVGIEAAALELSVQELEERIAPRPTFTDVLVSS